MNETNWTKWSSVAEIISSIAILVTLVYLAIQTQQNTVTLNSIASQGLQTQIENVLELPASDAELADVLSKGLRNPESLSLLEAVRFRNFFNLTLSAWQNMYFQARLGSVEFSLQGWFQDMSNYYHLYPGFKRHWERNKFLMDQEFQDYAENVVFMMEPIETSIYINTSED